jgi:hypothetical protein
VLACASAAATGAGPANRFLGRLILGEERPGGMFRVLRDDYDLADVDGGAARHLPPFDFAFVQSGSAIIPFRRGAIPSTHPLWEYILEPGTVSDALGGFSHAQLPFTVEERNANCMHYGVLDFDFRDDGAISDVSYAIASETCPYFKFDMLGRSAASYRREPVPDAARIVRSYQGEREHWIPAKPIEALATDYPGTDPSQFGSPDEVNPADMTVYGVVVDGAQYIGGCNTRAGLYPFCTEMDLPSYSVAKSIFAGLAAMRLSHLFPHAMRERVGDYVPDCAARGTWGDVTFENQLDMASGHYLSSLSLADEGSPDMQGFFLPEDHASKIAFSCDHYPRQAQPGTLWVYHTTDAYTLGTAMRGFYEAHAGSGHDFYRELLALPLWRPLHLDPALDVSRRTYDAIAQPFTGYGLTLHGDDIAKLAIFLNVDDGHLAGKTVLDERQLAAALQRDPRDPGLPAGSTLFRYNNGFWAWNAQATLGCRSPAWIPFMSGYGGIVVALLPNGIAYYYVSDGGSFAWAKAAAEADKMRPFCDK